MRLVHTGPYDQMPGSYAQLDAYMSAHQLTRGEVSWEDYVSDPGTTAPEELITHIYYQIQQQD